MNNQELGGRSKKEAMILILTFTILIALTMLATNNLTGLVTQTTQEQKTLTINQNYTQNQEIQLETKTTRITATGTYTGQIGDTARIYAKTQEGNLILIQEITITQDTQTTISPFTAKVTQQEESVEEEYAEEEVEEVEGVEEEYAEEEVEEVEGVEEEYAEEEVEEVEGVEEEYAEEEVEEEESVEEEYVEENYKVQTFTQACQQTCILQETNITTIVIELQTGKLYLKEIIYIEIQEHTNELKKIVPNFEIKINETLTITPEEYFEGEELIFDAKSSEGYLFEIHENQISVTPQQTGTWESMLYAIKDEALLVSNKFNITITGEETTEEETEEIPEEDINEEELETEETIIEEIELNETITENLTENITSNLTENITLNLTENLTENITLNLTENLTENITLNLTELCNNPDPNTRPLECIQNDNSTFFQEEDLVIENTRAQKVARFTPIGNLLIKGDYIENTQEQPNNNDYQLGYTNNDGAFIPTVWINSNTGDLHLKGKLTEANTNIVFELGKYGITNKRGILLAIIDRQTGDMTIRGSVVPYRRSLD